MCREMCSSAKCLGFDIDKSQYGSRKHILTNPTCLWPRFQALAHHSSETPLSGALPSLDAYARYKRHQKLVLLKRNRNQVYATGRATIEGSSSQMAFDGAGFASVMLRMKGGDSFYREERIVVQEGGREGPNLCSSSRGEHLVIPVNRSIAPAHEAHYYSLGLITPPTP